MVSVSGIRGIVGESIIPDIYLKYVMAYSTLIGRGKIIVGSDTRVSKELLRSIVYSGLISTGAQIIDIGIVPTPTVGKMVSEFNANGGIAITASHNPPEWNALKFFSSKGTFLNKEEFNKLMDIFTNEKFELVSFNKLKSVKKFSGATMLHIKKILSHIDIELIKSKKFKVAVDLCNGAACFIVPDLLEELGCEYVTCFDNPSGLFERVAEPLPENLGRLKNLVRESGADIGFAIDPDADRVAVVDEKGKVIGEERSCTLAAYHVLKYKEKSDIAVNLSTTMAVDDVAKIFGVKVFRTPIGEANVISKMLEKKLIIGGEGNGGVIYKTMHLGRDASTGIALFLELMAKENKPISEINKVVPTYPMVKTKLSIDRERISNILENLKKEFSDKKLNTEDGVKIIFEGGWVHVRPSGTEPIVRLYAEAKNKNKLNEYVKLVKSNIK